MRRPPGIVALVARTHWLVGGVALVAIGSFRWFTRNLPVEFGPHTYLIAFSIAGFYLLGGTLVWFGAPLGRVCSRICGLLYLTRPQMGSRLWEIMDSAEFQAHFAASRRQPPAR